MVERIVIFGGTGFLGKRLIERLKNDYKIIVASRNVETVQKIKGVDYLTYTQDVESYMNIISGSNIVVNFSGASIAGRRWNEEYKRIMYNSRINTTKFISEAIYRLNDKPVKFISTSATGIYGNRGDEILDESSSEGNDFLAKMCIDWENAALKSRNNNLRTVCIRVGVVLDKSEGGLKRMIQPFKYFVGGRLGSGSQYLPWIHVDDIVNIYLEAIKNANYSGVINGTAPFPVTNTEFSTAVAKIMRRPNIFIVPKFMLKIILGEFAEFLTGSQRAVPRKLLNNGFKFRFVDIKSALDNLIN